MEMKKLIKFSSMFFAILFLVTFLFSLSFNQSMRKHLNDGLLENTRVELNEDYTKSFYYKDVKMNNVGSYSEAIQEPKYGVLLYANDGLIYNRKTPIGTQSFVVAFPWLPNSEFNQKEIIKYVNNNRTLMVFRTMYLSSGWLYMFLLYVILLFVYKLIYPTILYFLTSFIAYIKYKTIPFDSISKEQFKNFELFRSLIFTSTTNRLDKNTSFLYVTMFFSYLTIYMLYLNNTLHLFYTVLPTIISIYISIIVFLCLYKTTSTLRENELKKLMKEFPKD